MDRDIKFKAWRKNLILSAQILFLFYVEFIFKWRFKKMIEKILTASTGNITKEDAEKLKTEDQFFVGNFEFGFIMFVVPMLGLYAGYSEAFHKIIEIATQSRYLASRLLIGNRRKK